MSKLSARKRRVKRTVSIGKVAPEAVGQVEDLDGRIEAIQWLIPLGLKAVTEELQRAVVELARPRYERKGSDQPLRRWGSQPGSVYLGDQKLPVDVPRVRNVGLRHRGVAARLPGPADASADRRRSAVADAEGHRHSQLRGLRRNRTEAFGLSRSSVSRRDVKGTARKLAEFQERSLVALFLDGKSFADEKIIIALGVTLDGQKIPLGFVQAATGNERVCRRFLSDLVERGLQYEAGLLVVIDDGKGFYKSVMSVLEGPAYVQRCQYHKRQNVVSYLPKSEQVRIRRKMEAALRQTDVRGGQGRAGRAQTGLETDEPVRPGQSRGRLRRDPHAPPVGADADAQGFLPHPSWTSTDRSPRLSCGTVTPRCRCGWRSGGSIAATPWCAGCTRCCAWPPAAFP